MGSGVADCARLSVVSHPSLGLPPPDMTAGFPEAAARLDAARGRLGARALEIALDRDPTIRERYDEIALRQLLRDTETCIDRLADVDRRAATRALARECADTVAPLYRRRGVPMDDLISLSEGLRTGRRHVLAAGEMRPRRRGHRRGDRRRSAGNRRIAGDARKRNRLLQVIYKGA